MMKVCHMTVAHEATDIRIFEKECKSLTDNGYDVSIVAPGKKNSVKDGVKIYAVDLLSHNPLYRLFFGARKIYKKALELEADVYHFHDIELFKYGIKLKKYGKKVIFDSHEDWIGYTKEIKWLPSFLAGWLSDRIRKNYKKDLHRFDVVISTSPHISDILEKFASKVKMITNYPIVDVSKIIEVQEEEFIERENRLCYAGTVYSTSNQETIIRSLQGIDDVKYYVIGPVKQSFKNELQRLDKSGHVVFVDKVPKADLYEYYKKAVAGLVIFDYSPNIGYKKGTLGSNKMFEYMLLGLPLISSDQELWKEQIIDKYQCGICVEPGNSLAVKEAIEQILNDKTAAFQMGSRGRRAVVEEFNWKTQESILLDVYRDLLN